LHFLASIDRDKFTLKNFRLLWLGLWN